MGEGKAKALAKLRGEVVQKAPLRPLFAIDRMKSVVMTAPMGPQDDDTRNFVADLRDVLAWLEHLESRNDGMSSDLESHH